MEEQESIREETVAMATALDGRRPNRAESVKIKKQLFARERQLLEDGNELVKKLEEEKARVFGYVMVDALADVEQISHSLKRNDVGDGTQFLEQEVIRNLSQLKEALEEEIRRRRQRQQQQPPQQSQPTRPPLVPPVAELLMLKRMQVEVAERTQTLERAREITGELSPFQEQVLERLSLKQGSIIELIQKIAEDFRERLAQQNPEEEEEDVEDDASEPPDDPDGDG